MVSWCSRCMRSMFTAWVKMVTRDVQNSLRLMPIAHCAGHVLANTRPIQFLLSDTSIVPCQSTFVKLAQACPHNVAHLPCYRSYLHALLLAKTKYLSTRSQYSRTISILLSKPSIIHLLNWPNPHLSLLVRCRIRSCSSPGKGEKCFIY